MANRIAVVAGRLSPWWRFRMWRLLSGRRRYERTASSAAVWAKVGPHDYEMKLSTSDWVERYALSCGFYYQDEIVALIEGVVEPGDIFIDIGANMGFISLLASSRVGPKGMVYAFEPNKNLVDGLRDVISRNSISNVEVREVALGAEEGEAYLEQGDHHGTNSLAAKEGDGGIAVRVCRGESELAAIDPGARAFIKIDVEGFEFDVIRGLGDFLDRDQVSVIVEMGNHANRFNSSDKEIFAFLLGKGFVAHRPRLGVLSGKVYLQRLERPVAIPVYDAYFTKS